MFMNLKDYMKKNELPIYLEGEVEHLEKLSKDKLLYIILIRDGELVLEINGSKRVFNQKSVIIINETVKLKFIDKSHLNYDLICFTPKILNNKFEYEHMYDLGNLSLSIMDRRDVFLLLKFAKAKKGYVEYPLDGLQYLRVIDNIDFLTTALIEKVDAFWPCRTRSYFLELLLFINNLSDYIKCEKTHSANRDILDIIAYIDNNLEKNLSLDELVSRFAINRTTLNNKFKEMTDQPVKNYIINRKLVIATTILKDTQLPIKEVGIRVGYYDSSNFTRIFKKYLGCSPSDYRNNDEVFYKI